MLTTWYRFLTYMHMLVCRCLQIVGGIMFLLFGAHSLWTGPE